MGQRGVPFRPPNSFSPQRFGSALGPWGSLQLKNRQFAKDFRPIDEDCDCPTCQRCAVGLRAVGLRAVGLRPMGRG